MVGGKVKGPFKLRGDNDKSPSVNVIAIGILLCIVGLIWENYFSKNLEDVLFGMSLLGLVITGVGVIVILFGFAYYISSQSPYK